MIIEDSNLRKAHTTALIIAFAFILGLVVYAGIAEFLLEDIFEGETLSIHGYLRFILMGVAAAEVFLMVIIRNHEKTYTLFNFGLLILALILALFDKTRLLNRFYITFLIILIPFFIVNAILTGTFIPGEVVWYNNSEILGIRLLTVPVEDTGYTFSLILLNLLMINRIQKMRLPVMR